MLLEEAYSNRVLNNTCHLHKVPTLMCNIHQKKKKKRFFSWVKMYEKHMKNSLKKTIFKSLDNYQWPLKHTPLKMKLRQPLQTSKQLFYLYWGSPPLYKAKITNSQKISVLEHEMNQTGFFINVQELILIIYLDFKGWFLQFN